MVMAKALLSHHRTEHRVACTRATAVASTGAHLAGVVPPGLCRHRDVRGVGERGGRFPASAVLAVRVVMVGLIILVLARSYPVDEMLASWSTW